MKTLEITINEDTLNVVARDSRGRQAILDLLREIEPALDVIDRAVRFTPEHPVR